MVGYPVNDALANVMTGLGTSKDRAVFNTWSLSQYDAATLATIYVESWLARRCVDLPADECTAKWREISTPSMTPDQIDRLVAAERAIGLRGKIAQAVKWARLFGGGAIYVAVEGQDIGEPLEIERIRRGSRVNIHVFSRNEITPDGTALNDDEFSVDYGAPLAYQLNRSGAVIHSSRLVVLRGIPMPDVACMGHDRYWGAPMLDSSLVAAIERCETALASLTEMLEQSTVDVLKIPELFEKLVDPESEARLKKRIADGALIKSAYKTLMVDGSEEFVRAEAAGSVSAGPAAVNVLLQMPSAATGIPATKLLGISPGGLNATGESDSENYHGLLDSIRQDEVERVTSVVDPVLCMSVFGRMYPDWSAEWESFWSTDNREESDIRTARLNGIVQLVTAGILPYEVALRQIHQDGIYPAMTDDDVVMFESLGGSGGIDGEIAPATED